MSEWVSGFLCLAAHLPKDMRRPTLLLSSLSSPFLLISLSPFASIGSLASIIILNLMPLRSQIPSASDTWRDFGHDNALMMKSGWRVWWKWVVSGVVVGSFESMGTALFYKEIRGKKCTRGKKVSSHIPLLVCLMRGFMTLWILTCH